MDTSTAITLAIALVGVLLGVINTWQAIARDRIRLRVTPKVYVTYGGGKVLTASAFPTPGSSTLTLNPDFNTREHDFCIEIVNLGFVGVVLSDVGFLMRKTKDRASIRDRIILDGGEWPRHLSPRQAVTLFIPPDSASRLIYAKLRCAYAVTECGLTFRGVSKVFKELVRKARLEKPPK